MINLLKKIFGVHSPSKVYIEAIKRNGKLIAEGFAEGMKTVKNDPEFIKLHNALKEYEKNNPALPSKKGDF